MLNNAKCHHNPFLKKRNKKIYDTINIVKNQYLCLHKCKFDKCF